MKMHEKYRFFSLYVVQKSPKIFLQWPKKLCHWQKKNTDCTQRIHSYFRKNLELES